MVYKLAAKLALAAVLPVQLSAQETEISFDVGGDAVRGVLSLPAGEPAPVVLLLHGFTGSRDELGIANTEEGVFSRSARILRENGYASLRIDFRGSGVSDGDWVDTTFSGQIIDGLAAVDWLSAAPEVDGSKIAALGWSQGGLVASHVADQSDAVDALVLWAPVTNPRGNFSNLIPGEVMVEAMAAGAGDIIDFKLPWGAEISLKAAFFHEMDTTSSAAAVAGYDGPMQVFMGSNDTTVTPQPGAGEMLMSYHEGVEELHVLEMDHVFNVFGGPETLDQEMLPKVLVWLKQHL